MTNLEKWNYYLRELESPKIFIDWTLYWTISSALQRRVFIGNYKHDPMFANIYNTFVADPGVGKSMPARKSGVQILKQFRFIDPIKQKSGIAIDKCWTDNISFSADNTTIQSLIDQLNKSTRACKIPLPNEHGNVIEQTTFHASMSILLSEEMSSLFKTHDDNVTPFLNQCWDANNYHYKTKTKGEDNIKNVCVAFLGCTTPDNMRKLMASGALQTGFTARTIPIYAEKPRHQCYEYSYTKEMEEALLDVRKHVKMLLEVRGEVTLSNEAREYLKLYYEGTQEIKDRKRNGENVKTPMEADRINYDKRTDDYYGRKKTHIYKVAMCLHFMETYQTNTIELPTLIKAINALKEVEVDMHKALASAGKNPLADFYKEVYECICENKALTTIQIKIIFKEDLDGEKVDVVLKWLSETGKIEMKNIDSRMKWVKKEGK